MTYCIEKGKRSFGAYVPDFPGCVAVGKTRGAVVRLIQKAIKFHLEMLREDVNGQTFLPRSRNR